MSESINIILKALANSSVSRSTRGIVMLVVKDANVTKYKELGLPNNYYITIATSKFYSEQDKMWQKFKKRLKMIWYAVRGKEYRLCEICITDDDMDELIKKLEEIKK